MRKRHKRKKERRGISIQSGFKLAQTPARLPRRKAWARDVYFPDGHEFASKKEGGGGSRDEANAALSIGQKASWLDAVKKTERNKIQAYQEFCSCEGLKGERRVQLQAETETAALKAGKKKEEGVLKKCKSSDCRPGYAGASRANWTKGPQGDHLKIQYEKIKRDQNQASVTGGAGNRCRPLNKREAGKGANWGSRHESWFSLKSNNNLLLLIRGRNNGKILRGVSPSKLPHEKRQ